MSQLYGRRASIVIGNDNDNALDFSRFKCSFSINRGDSQTPNYCDLRIYNLSDATVSQVNNEFTRIAISCAYGDDSLALIFSGTIKQVRKGRQNGRDTFLDVTAADGDEAYQYATAIASVPGGSGPGSIAKVLGNALAKYGVSQGYQPTWPENTCVRGKVLYGLARDESRLFAEQQNCSWSIQDGGYTIIPKTSFQNGEVTVISASGGMVDAPEQTQDGIRIRTLLNPRYKIGSAIQLDAEVNQLRFGLDTSAQAKNALLQKAVKTDPSGYYYVMNVTHTGDTRGRTWYSDLTCLSVTGIVPNPNALNALVALDADAIPRIR